MTRRRPIAPRAGLAIAVLLVAAPALTLDPGKTLTQYALDLWETTEGLPQSSVFAICQTTDGYLWLGTQGGLVRFDGERFVVFDTRTSPGLRHNFVSAIVRGQDDTLWIGTVGGGLSRRKEGRFTTIGVEDGLPSSHVRALAIEPDGTLWIGTDAGLARLSAGSLSPLTTLTTRDGLANDLVKALAVARDGTLWIGTDGGLQAYRDRRFRTWTTREGLPDDRVLALLPDAGTAAPEGKSGGADATGVWVGTQGGLARLAGSHVTTLRTADGLGNDVVIALHEDRRGSLWIGTYGGGISRLRDGAIATLRVGQGLSNEIVTSLFEDREGSLWVGTNGGGLHRFKDTKLTMVTPREGLSGDLVLSIQEDPDGVLWLGTAGNGLNRYDHGAIRTLGSADGLPSDIVFSTCRDREGTLWIGTDGGLARLEGDRAAAVPGGPRRVRALFEAGDGTLWIGTDGDGLMSLDGSAFTRHAKPDGPSHDVVSSIAEDAAGDLWVGTEIGLNRRHGGAWTTFTSTDGLAADFVLTLFPEGERLWIGTFAGLSLWSGGRLRTFTEAEGLTEGPIGGILEDTTGNFWMSTNNGIFRIAKAELLAVAAGRAPAARPTWYGTGDGMRSAECNGGFQPAGARTRDGRLWFPTVKGAVVIDPENIPVNRLPPPVLLEELLVDREPVALPPEGSELVIPPGAEKIDLSYTAPSLLQTSRVRFKYLLQGYDRDWVDAGTDRTAHYTSLPPRHYTFRVIACNDDGVWNEAGASLAFHLKPHFYQTPWFWALCAAALVASALGVHRTRVRQLEARERHLSALVAEKTHHLRLAIEELSVKNEELARLDAEKNEFLGIVAHDLKNPLNVIRGYAELMVEEDDLGPDERKGLLGKVMTASQRMLELIMNLLDVNAIERGEVKYQLAPCDLGAMAAQVVETYARPAAAKGQTVSYEPPPTPAVAHADPGITQQVLDNLVSNAVKYSPHGKSIHVRVRPLDGKVRFEVQDEGPGISPGDQKKLFGKFARLTARPTAGEHSTGLGLSIVKRMVEAMHGSVWCESQPGAGATFLVELPASPRGAARPGEASTVEA